MGKISTEQLEKMQLRAFENSLRLHFDAYALFTLKSFPSAFFLDVLALEEFGKIEIIDFVINHCNEPDKKFYNKVFSSLYHHKSKQNFVLTNYFHPLPTQRLRNFFKNMEGEKQKAVYVGIKKGNNHLIVPSKIVNRKKAKKQILFFNDLLFGLMTDQLFTDNEEIERLIKSKKVSSRIKEIKTL